jgi:hypothetical protein
MTPKKKLSEIVKDMAGLKRQWANTTPAPDADKPIPPGTYVCELVGGEPFEARTGTPGFKVTLKVKDGLFAGRLVWHDFYLSEKALPYTMRALGKVGVTDLDQLDEGLPAGLVVKARVVVNKRDSGDERNEVRTWELVEVNPAAPSPTAPPPPAAATGSPWAVDLATLDETHPKRDEDRSFDFSEDAERGGP